MILSCGHDYDNGSGRRKRCPACAAAAKLAQDTQRRKDHKERIYDMTCKCESINHAEKVNMCAGVARKVRVVSSAEDLRALELVSGRKWQVGDQYTIEEVCKQPE